MESFVKRRIKYIHTILLFIFFPLLYTSLIYNARGIGYSVGMPMLFPRFLAMLLLVVSVLLTEAAIFLPAGKIGLGALYVFWCFNMAMYFTLFLIPAFPPAEGVYWEIPPFSVLMLLPFWGVIVVFRGTLSRWIFPAVCLLEASHLIWTLWKHRKRAQ